MEGHRAAASETVDAQVSGGPRVDTTWYRYAGMDTGYA